jgi:hypothetical protein
VVQNGWTSMADEEFKTSIKLHHIPLSISKKIDGCTTHLWFKINTSSKA